MAELKVPKPEVGNMGRRDTFQPALARELVDYVITACTARNVHLPSPRALPLEEPPEKAQVLAIGDALRRIAQLYAYFTGRTFGVQVKPRLGVFSSAEVVVIAPKDLNEGGLDELYSSNRAFGAGLLLAPTEIHALDRMVELLSHWSQPGRGRLAGIFSNGPAFSVDTASLFLGGDWETYLKSTFRQESEGVGALVVETHSDGIDARLGQKHILCSQRTNMAGFSDSLHVPRCTATDFCHRLQEPVQHALGNAALVPTSELRASLIFWATCFGLVLPSDAVHRYKGSLLDQAELHGSYGAIITTTGPAYLSRRLVYLAAALIARGVSAGRLVSLLNHSEIARVSSLRLILIGEPLTRIDRMPGHVPIPRKQRLLSKNLENASTESPGKFGDVVFALSCVRGLPQEVGIGADSQNSPLTSIGSIPTKETTPIDLVMKVVNSYGASGATLFDCWMRGWRPTSTKRTRDCGMCTGSGRSLKSITMVWEADTRASRTISFCEECGICEDLPLEWRGPVIQFSGGLLHLVGVAVDTQARVHVRSKQRNEAIVYDWPAGADGQLKEIFRLPTLPFSGPLEVGILIRNGLSIAVYSRRWRPE